MEENRRNRPPFSGSQNAVERILALLWLPIHLFLLPRVVSHFFPGVDGSWLNLAVYAAGAGYMLVTQFRFLRQDFDPLCDRPGYMLLEILISYGAMLLFNMAVSGILMLLSNDLENPNNAAVVDMAMSSSGPISAVAVFLAPLTEELIFRAGIFGGLRKKSRLAAYLVSVALFALYHVWSYALSNRDWMVLLYALQYVPVSYLLCRIYERTNSIWGSILLHMFSNFVALHALTALERLL